MTRPTSELRPFCKLSPDEDRQNVAALIRSAQEAPEEDFPRLRWRLRHDLRQPSARPLLRAALIAGGMFLTGGVVGAVVRPFLPVKPGVPFVPAEPPAPAKPRPTGKKVVAPTPAVPPAPPIVVPALPSPIRGEPTPVPSHRGSSRLARLSEPPPPAAPTTPAVEVAMPEPPSPVAIEQALLADALRSLRKQGDPRSALALLDDHTRRFPHTVLAPEAGMLRAEALLALGRNGEALSELDRLPLGSMPKADARLVVRGELRAVAGRWREALSDFEAQLSSPAAAGTSPASPDLGERALWGRASARSHLGDEAGARADLASYLRTYPSGRFAARAAALLQVAR